MYASKSSAYAVNGKGYPTAIPQIHFELSIMASFKFDTDAMKKELNWLEKEQLPFVLKNTINDLAFGMRRQVIKGMEKYYEGGATPFSERGIQVKKATKKDLYGVVFTAADREYLATTMFGGVVRPFEGMKALVQPAAQKVNKYGNIPRKTFTRKAANSKKYFVGKPTGAKRNQPTGLYQVYKRKAPKLIIKFNDKSRYQKAFFPAPDISAKYFRQQWFKMYEKNFRKAMKDARPRRMPTGF